MMVNKYTICTKIPKYMAMFRSNHLAEPYMCIITDFPWSHMLSVNTADLLGWLHQGYPKPDRCSIPRVKNWWMNKDAARDYQGRPYTKLGQTQSMFIKTDYVHNPIKLFEDSYQLLNSGSISLLRYKQLQFWTQKHNDPGSFRAFPQCCDFC